MSLLWKTCFDTDDCPDVRQCFESLDSVFRLEGKHLTRDLKSEVIYCEIGGRGFYIKRYRQAGKSLRRWLGRSRVRTEWENLQFFRRLGIATPDLLAYGEEKHRGIFRRGALVTRALGVKDLQALSREQSPLLHRRNSFRQLASLIADHVRKMHDSRFAHNDLDWRNILVAERPALRIYFFDCPCGSRWHWPFLGYRKMKDLAHLDKLARETLPASWRLWFYHQYTGRKRLTARDKKILRQVIHYYESRRRRGRS
jgi:tRNA A-37 threonylcarbamoyl transferase component Bud32